MLLAVLTCQSATETAQRHWPSWRRHFENIVFVTTVDSKCWVPEGISEWKFGRDFYNDRDRPCDNLCRRTLDVLEEFYHTGEDSLCLIEYDVLLFAEPTLNGDFSGTMFSEFIHPPWVFSRGCAFETVKVGREFLRHGQHSGGWPDRHLKMILDTVQPEIDPNENYSYNTIGPDQIEDARQAVKRGAFAIHGCKHQEIFQEIMRDTGI